MHIEGCCCYNNGCYFLLLRPRPTITPHLCCMLAKNKGKKELHRTSNNYVLERGPSSHPHPRTHTTFPFCFHWQYNLINHKISFIYLREECREHGLMVLSFEFLRASPTIFFFLFSFWLSIVFQRIAPFVLGAWVINC